VSVAIVHDYLTQRGGAERVVLSMLKAFPGAPLYTSFYDPGSTFPEFADADVRTLPLDGIRPLRKHHRLALPLLAPAFSRCRVRADVVVCSSSGWAHGVSVEGRKVVYCYSPARWLYQPARYLGEGRPLAGCALGAMRSYLLAWDRRAAATADSYVTTSRAVAANIRHAYGIEASLVPPPHALDPLGPGREVGGVEPGFVLCVSRLLAYKNLEPVVDALRASPDLRLVLVGTGPEGRRLMAETPANVCLLGSVTDDELRWLYRECAGLIAASYEDYGLTPLEAAAFGKPSAVLRWGGFLDTVIDGETGVYFDRPDALSIQAALRAMNDGHFSPTVLQGHAGRYSEARFIKALRIAVMGKASGNDGCGEGLGARLGTTAEGEDG
jgi:glycosyltransferase involved in cell wall biosynthesis